MYDYNNGYDEVYDDFEDDVEEDLEYLECDLDEAEDDYETMEPEEFLEKYVGGTTANVDGYGYDVETVPVNTDKPAEQRIKELEAKIERLEKLIKEHKGGKL